MTVVVGEGVQAGHLGGQEALVGVAPASATVAL